MSIVNKYVEVVEEKAYMEESKPIVSTNKSLRLEFEKENVNKIAVKHFRRHPVSGTDVREGM